MKNLKWYVEVSDGVKRKTPPEMIKVSELPTWQAKHQSSTQGLFSSIYMYSTDDPYIGGVISDFYMDFDCQENPDKARKEAVAVVKKLIRDYDISEDNIRIAFSGMKGASVTVDYQVFGAESSANLPLIWKSIVTELIKKSKLKTADTHVYERRRLWRLLNSRHQKSGLYKIPLTLAELETRSIDKIKQMADKPRELFIKGEARPVPKAEKLFEKHRNKVEKWLEERKKSFEKTELRTFTDDPPCVKHRLEIGAKAGSRNFFLFQLAVYYAHKGLSEPEILKIGYEFANHCEQEPEPFPRSGEVESIVSSAIKGVQDGRYSVGCSSEALVDLCDRENCPFFKKPKEKELKYSCGEDLQDKVFEQIRGEQFLIYDKTTGEIRKQKEVEGFKSIKQRDLLWEEYTVDNIEDYESEEKLWSEVKRYLWEHIDLREGYDVLTAWVFVSWVPEKWLAVPYLFFYGPAGSGKTWALEILKSIGFRSFLTANITTAVLFRICDCYSPTLLLDETETYMVKDRRDIIYLLNSGYRKGSKAVRMEDTKEGYKIRVFKTFGFKALSGTKELIETLRSRCIIFNMSEATRDVKTRIDEKRAETLRKKLLAYRFKTLSKKETEETPEAAKALKGRLRELFGPLMIVAPPSAKQSIISEAEKIRKTVQEEQKASDEAIVFKAIVEAYEENLEEKKITIKQIVDILNKDLLTEGLGTEEWKSVSVGMVCSRLGFKRTMKKRKRAIFWNQQLAERLARKYYPEWVSAQKALMSHVALHG
jgi:hypothetical protein